MPVCRRQVLRKHTHTENFATLYNKYSLEFYLTTIVHEVQTNTCAMVILRHFFWFLRLFVFPTVKVQKYQRLPAKCPLVTESINESWIYCWETVIYPPRQPGSLTGAEWPCEEPPSSHSPPFNVLPLESSPSVCTMGWVSRGHDPQSPEPALWVTKLSQRMPEEVHSRKETFSPNWVPNFQKTSQKLLIETHSFSSDLYLSVEILS